MRTEDAQGTPTQSHISTSIPGRGKRERVRGVRAEESVVELLLTLPGMKPQTRSEFPTASEKVALFVLWGSRCRWVCG